MRGRFYNDRPAKKYAAALLAELITRAKALEALTCKAIEASGACQVQYLEELAQAVEVFMMDVYEAQGRGVKAGLFGEGSFGFVSPDLAGDPEAVVN